MKFTDKRIVSLISLLTVGIAVQLLAHDAWVEPGTGPVFRVLYGHKAPEPYKFAKVTLVNPLDAEQHPLKFSRTETSDGLTIKTTGGRPVLFTVEFDNGYWVTVDNKRRNVRQSQLPAGTKSTDPSRPLKFSKTMLTWQPWMARPLGQRIEFVPQGLTAMPKAGSGLRLQLLLNGKPLGGQMVENNSNEQGPKTDTNGYVTVTVLKGMNRFATDHDITQPNDADGRRLGLTAALVFVAQ